jgi:hypothetical protein
VAPAPSTLCLPSIGAFQMVAPAPGHNFIELRVTVNSASLTLTH